MKLLIRAYLELLKESQEFDAIVSDLLLAMGITPISRPQIGVRQAGVDIAAVGKDTTGCERLFLCVLKRGDITRREWDGDQQAIRPSLNQIKDSYLHSRIDQEHKDLPKRVLLCCGGELRQEVKEDWSGYTQRETTSDIDFQLWNGDTFAGLIDEHLLNENVLPPAARNQFRRAIALVGDENYDLSHYYRMLGTVLLEPFGPEHRGTKAKKKLTGALRTAALCLSILFRWAEDDDNLANALLAAERTLLWGWEAVRRAELAEDKQIIQREYSTIFKGYFQVLDAYVAKLQAHYQVRDGLAAQSNDSVVISEIVFREIGLVALAAMAHGYFLRQSEEELFKDGFAACIEALESIIANNAGASSPCYDGHVIEVFLGLLALNMGGKPDAARNWLAQLGNCLRFSHARKQRFPVATDNFDDAVELAFGHADDDKVNELRSMSWLIPTLAQWCLVLGRDDLYRALARGQEDAFAGICLQLWYFDEGTDERLWVGSALGGGVTQAPITLPAEPADFARDLVDPKRVQKRSPVDRLSAVKAGIPLIDLVACRHYRVPVPEDYLPMPANRWPPSEPAAEVTRP